jgi:hypothetical protein
MTRITRGQIGCLAHCRGSTTRGITLNGRRRNLRRLLSALARRPSAEPAAAAGTTQSTVHQSSRQWQRGLTELETQRQRSSQASITVQSVQVSRKLIESLPAALSSSASPVAAAVNQTVQNIWQLQIGCLFHCAHTRQVQKAKQASTTVQTVPPHTTAAAAEDKIAQDSTAQSIWQLQVGCLLWCIDATEQQLARSRHVTLMTTATARPTGAEGPSSIQLESTVASQTGGSGGTVVVTSQQLNEGSISETSAGRPHLHHHHVMNRKRHGPSKPSEPRSLVVRSDAMTVPASDGDLVLGVVLGVIVLLAALTASRVVPGRRQT